MAKGKKKKKKSSQTDCENSSTAKESHGTRINHKEAPDITHCTCLTQPQRRKTFLPCFAKKATPPNCPHHSSKDSTLIQTPKSKEKDTTNQPCIVRRIGRWIVKKVTKGKKEEQIPTETLELESETVCVNNGEPPRLQILCQQVLSANGPEGFAQATTTTDNSVEPRSIDTTTNDNVNPETDRNIVISLKELCMTVVDNSGSKITDISDSKQDVAIDEAQPIEYIPKLDNDEYNQITVMSLKDMCKAAIAYPDDLEYNIDDFKTDHTDEQENYAKSDPEQDTASINSESDCAVLMTLIQMCTKAVNTADNKKTTNLDDEDTADDAELIAKDVNQQGFVCEETLSKKPTEKKTKLNKDDMKPEHDQITVMSLKDMCKAAMRYPDDFENFIDDTKTDDPDEQDNNGISDAETDTASIGSESEGGVLMTLIQLCTKVISNDEDKKTTNADDKYSAKDVKLSTKNVNHECDSKELMSLKDICRAAVSSTNARTEAVIDTENTDCKTTDMNESKQEFAKETVEKKTKLNEDDMKPEHDQITIMSLKDMCKAAVKYPDDFENFIADTKTDDPDEQDNNGISVAETDTASISSESEGGVLMTLIQLCTKVISNDEDKKTTNADDTYSAKDVKLSTNDVNHECDSKELMSLKDICRAAVSSTNARTEAVIDFENTACKTTDMNDSKQEFVKERIEKKTKLNKDDMKPEHEQITVMSLKDMCKVAVKYPDEFENFIDDTKTDNPDEQVDSRISDAETDTARIGSESEGGVLMTLIQLCTKVISHDEDKKTTNADDTYSAKDVKLSTKDVKHECDSKELMSLKDICRAAVSSTNARTEAVIDTENTGCKTTDMNDSKQEFAREPIEKKTKLNEDAMKPENDQVVVMSLKEICKSALTYHDDMQYNTDSSNAHHINDKLDVDDPELDNGNNIFDFDDSALKTLSQLCAKVISHSDDKNTSDRDSKDKANDSKLNTEDVKLECDDKRLKSLKDICKAVIKSAASKTMVVNGAEKSSDAATKCENTRILSLRNDANDETAKYLDDKELCKSTDKQQEINHETKLKYDKSTSKSLKELCLMKLGNVDDMKTSDFGAQKEKSNKYDINPTTDNKPHNANVIKQGNTYTECDKIEAKSLKELCTKAVRGTYTGSAKVKTKDVYPEQDKVQDDDNEAHDESNVYDSDNLDVSFKSGTALAKPMQKEFCSVHGNEFHEEVGFKNTEKEYTFVKVTNNVDENYITNQYSVEKKSKCLRDIRSATSQTPDGTNTTINEMSRMYGKRQTKSEDFGNDKQDIKSQPDKMSVQSQIKSCREPFKIAGKFYETFKERNGYKAGIKRGDDENIVKFLRKRQKASTKDAGDQKIGIRYNKLDQDNGIQFKLDEELSDIMIENTKAIAMTLKELTNADKDSENVFKTELGYKGNIHPIYDKNKLRSLTRNRSTKEIILENDKAIAMTLKELSSATDDNADNMLTRKCDNKQVQVNNTNKFNIHESNSLDLFSGYDPNSPMTLKELYLKTMRKTDGVKEDIHNIQGDQAADKDRGGARDLRPSLNKFSDMTDYMQKHYLLTSALLALMEMCDKESLQIKDEDIDQYMAKESDTKKECVRELFHLAENLNKISEATMNDIASNDEKQEQANDTVRHQDHSIEIRKVDDRIGEKRATVISKDVAAVNTKCRFRKTNEIQSVTDSNLVQTTDQETVYGIAVIGQIKEDARFREAHGGIARNKEMQKNVCDSSPERAIKSVNDDETDHQKHANKTDIDKIYQATQAHSDIVDVSQMADSVEGGLINVKHVNVDGLQDMEVISADEVTKQNVEVKAKDKKRDKAAKGQERMMEMINTTTAAARAMADEAGIGYQRDKKTDGYKTNIEPEYDSQDNNQELFLPAETVCELMVDTYNERRYKTKKKSRNKAKMQFEIDYKVNMDGKIVAAELPESLHTLTDIEYIQPGVDEENMKARKKRNANSHCAGKAGKDRKKYKGARQRSHNIPEQKTGAKLKQTPRGGKNENMTLAAVYCDDLVYISKSLKNPTSNQTQSEVSENVEGQRGTAEMHLGAEGQARPALTPRGGKNENMTLAAVYCDDLVYISKTSKNPTSNQTPSEVSENVEGQRGTEEMHLGAEGQARPGSLADQSKVAETPSERYAEQKSGSFADHSKLAEVSSECYAEQKSDTTAAEPGSPVTAVEPGNPTTTTKTGSPSTAAASQKSYRKKKQKRKKAKWY